MSEDRKGQGVAIVGMAGRFPGARSVDELWQNLLDGVESVSALDPAKWAETAGVHPALLDRPDLVKMKPKIDDEFLFDAGFFGYTPREAQILDPQQRIFLECAWEALECAGYDSERFPGAIGVAAGVSQSSYLMNYLQWDQRLTEAVGGLNVGLGNMNDSLATRVAYKLNLRGPAYAVQSFCSTSLVAVHLGCQSLLGHEADMVLAGGATLYLPHEVGYQYQEGGILSPDGHTRTFDARARGMVFGSGIAVVALKRLADAVRDGDTVYAVILGSATNNDGSLKVGFTAPSVSGQAEVIAEALTAADVNPETIGYVEAHGTGTALGDPAEIAGLTKAWRRWTDRRGFCAIGSVKTNIGHLDAAAGVTGLIKTALVLQHGRIPASLHFETPNPAIDFAASPFHVNARLSEWTSPGPRRAAVSSFGIGGTNAHAVLEQAPPAAPAPDRDGQLLVLSARTEVALERAAGRLRAHLESTPGASLADVAWTLQVGRRVFAHRRAVVARDVADAVAALADPARADGAQQDRHDVPVAFLFTGQGSQYVNMGRGLYDTERRFREVVDAAAETLAVPLGLDLRAALYPRPGEEERAAERLQETFLTQPALFVVECALARLLMSWGLQPAAMIGHSVGEYVAAHLAGVFTFEDALALVAARGCLMQSMPRGAMLAVPASEEAVAAHLGAEVSLAAVNAPGACVLSGTVAAIEALEAGLAARGVMSRRLRTSHAFHSSMMDPILDPFREQVERTIRRPPQWPFLSNVSGTWIGAEEATDPGYWSRHLRGCVRFADGLATLQRDRAGIARLEVGPGNALATLARQQPAGSGTVACSLRHPRETENDRAFALRAVGRLWLSGVRIDWAGMADGERRRRVPLPTYPFERQEYRVPPSTEARHGFAIARGYSLRKQEIDDWFYQPSWRRVALPPSTARPTGRWLVFADDHGLGEAVVAELRRAGASVATVRPGATFASDAAGGFEIDPAERSDYARLLQRAASLGGAPTHVLHLWGVTAQAGASEIRNRLAGAQTRGFYSVLFLSQALASSALKDAVRLAVVTDGMQEVVGGDLLRPEKATVLGPCRVVSQELKNVSCLSVDVVLPAGTAERGGLAHRLVAELVAETRERMVAYRGAHRWVQWLERMPLGPETAQTPLREDGVYLITGGLGGIGLALAEHLARAHRARLVLTVRTPLPPRETWESCLGDGTVEAGVRQRIRSVRRLEELGGEVLVAAGDVTRLSDMEGVVAQALQRFGAIHGVIHAAGVAGGGLIPLKEREVAARVLAPKVEGTLVLEQVLRDQPLDFVALCSSTAAWVGGVGQVDYCGANAFLDAYALAVRAARATVSINWDAWREVGMAVNTPVSGALKASREISLKTGIGSAEGVEAFRRILGSGLPQVAVFTLDLMPRLLNRFVARPTADAAPAAEAQAEAAAAAAPREAKGDGDLERVIVESWRKVLGRDRIATADNFFELGGDSFTALQAMAHLKAALGREIPIVTLYESPTVVGLARALSAEARPEEPPLDLGDVGQRAGARLEMMQRRRRARTGQTLGSQESR